MTSERGLPLARRGRWRRPAASRGEHLAYLTSEGDAASQPRYVIT